MVEAMKGLRAVLYREFRASGMKSSEASERARREAKFYEVA